MSTLTKVLIVLLTTFSLFLCAMVVTYVAHVENQKDRADKLQARIGSAEKLQRAAEEDQRAAVKAAEQKVADLTEKIGELNAKIITLDANIVDLNRLRDEAVHQAAEKSDKADIATKTAGANAELLAGAQEHIKTLEANQTNQKKELDELNVLLMEKVTLLAQLEEKNKQLAEANQDISNRLNQYLQKYGVMAAPAKLATSETGIVSPAPSQPVRSIDLKGQVVGVDLQNNLAQVSLGAASGVKTNMTFHITRGEQFICDIVINSVDPDKAVGRLTVFDRNRAEPQVGDAISTNL